MEFRVTKRTILASLIVVGLFIFMTISSSVLETNKSGYYQVKQAAVTGKISVKNKPGMYLQNFGDIFTYQVSDIYYYSKHVEDKQGHSFAEPITVRFNDGGTADITGSLKFRLSRNEKDQIRLHEDFKSYDTVHKDLIRQVVVEALKQTAFLMKAEESYSTRRSEFISLAEGQIREGVYDTESEEEEVVDAQGNKFIQRSVKVKLDENGNPVVKKASPFRNYNIEVLQFVVKDIDFDETIDSLITKKKEAEQAKVVARAKAEESKQDAITAEEKGKAEVAKAKYSALVTKEKAVIEAQQKYEVAVQERKKAEEEAKAKTVRGEAEAKVARLKVAAGLTPLEKATIEKDTAIGVAEKLSSVKFPEMMIIGGSGGDKSALNPFDAVGLKSFIEISKDMAKPGTK